MKTAHPENDNNAGEIVRAYLGVLDGVGEGAFFAPFSCLSHSRETISRALLAMLRDMPGDTDWERWRAGYIELERFLGEKDWSLVEEFEKRAEQGPEAILAMNMKRMKAANKVTRTVSLRKLARMDELNESLLKSEQSTGE